MAEVRVRQTFPATVHEAERCWYDTRGWPRWIDGLETVAEPTGNWPREGSEVVWRSVPAGRGQVRERVIEYAPLRGQTVAVDDDSIAGTQNVVFEPASDGVAVELGLAYSIKRRSPLTPLIDRLFVRPAMARSLTKTLERFGVALAASR